jgi:hypothetical protein
MKTTRSVLLLLAGLTGTWACEKNAVQLIAGPQTGGANVKFFNFAVGSPAVNFYINDKKFTAVGSAQCFVLTEENMDVCLTAGLEATTGVAYGGAGNGANGWYSDVVPGQITITGRIAAATDKNLPISTAQANIVAGKFYSFYQSGIYNATTKTADSFIIEDELPPAGNFSVAYVRFVNASSTTNPMTLYATHRATSEMGAVGGEIAYRSGGAFVALPVGSYDLASRYAGSNTNVFSRTVVSFNPGRVYTITARGNTATASTMLLDNTPNR